MMGRFISKWMPFPNMVDFHDWLTEKSPHRIMLGRHRMNTTVILRPILLFGKHDDWKTEIISGNLHGEKADQDGISNVVP